jgi:UDP-glucuronate decarboxylase
VSQATWQARDVVVHDLEAIADDLWADWRALASSTMLITGGAGFLGYYLVHAVLHLNQRLGQEQAVSLWVWDNFSRGRPAWLDHLAHSNPNLKVQTQDMSAPLPSGMPRFDWIIHAAGIASPIIYRKHPLRTMDANIVGLRNLLDRATEQGLRGHPVHGFLYFSSSEIYGDPSSDAIPTEETYRGLVSCTGPRACYDESKRYGETLCTVFAQAHGVPTRMVRPFNNYGPGLKITDGRVIPDFASAIFEGRDLVMHSDGRPTRTFCYSADAATGYLKALIRGRSGEPYNIGTESPEISMAELARRMTAAGEELFGYRGSVRCHPSHDQAYLVDNPNRRCPNINKARSELGFNPRIEIHEGLRRALLWYRDNRDGDLA